MQFFVRRYEGADSPQNEYETVEAESAREAAELACGEPLTECGPNGRLRATVRNPLRPGAIPFYAIAQ